MDDAKQGKADREVGSAIERSGTGLKAARVGSRATAPPAATLPAHALDLFRFSAASQAAGVIGWNVSAIPEPGTGVLIGLGLAAVGTRRRRRKH